MTEFNLIIYDFDGTLCDTQKTIAYSIQETLAISGHERPNKKIILQALQGGFDLKETFARLIGSNIADSDFSKLKATYRQIYNKEESLKPSKLFDGVIETLNRFHKENRHQIIISNKGEQAILEALEFYKISQFIDAVIADDGKTPKKPDPTSFITRIQPQYPNIEPTSIIVVGDTIADIQYARNAGIVSCWVTYGYGNSSTCLNESPNFIIDKLSDLHHLLIR